MYTNQIICLEVLTNQRRIRIPHRRKPSRTYRDRLQPAIE